MQNIDSKRSKQRKRKKRIFKKEILKIKEKENEFPTGKLRNRMKKKII